jgi:hypothetical protein
MSSNYLKRELIWAVVLKLILLFAIKYAFFPHRLSHAQAEQGVAERIASSEAPGNTPPLKDKP